MAATIKEILDRVRSTITGSVINLQTKAKNLLVNAINEVYTMFPFGQKNQVFVAQEDNTNLGKYVDVIEVGSFVTTDAELEQAKGVFIGFGTIFSQWKRFSHGAAAIENNPTATIPYSPSETDSWNYDPATDRINSTVNSNTFIGFVSPLKYNKYTHTLTLNAQNGSESFNDNDWPAVVLAYAEDKNVLVPNNALGLNPSDFDWPIDVTSALIPKQYTLSLVRGRTAQQPYNIGQNLHYAIVYNLGQPDQKVIANGENSGVWNTENLFGSGKNCDVKIDRNGDKFTVLVTDWSDAPSGKGTLRFPLVADLTADPLLAIFRGSSSYGYAALSQQNSYFTNVYFSPNVNTIYNLQNGDVWEADSAGTYTLNASRNYFNEIGERRALFNPLTRNLIYVKPDRTFEILGGGGTGGGRFGYPSEDDTSDIDRSIDMQGHDLDIENLKMLYFKSPAADGSYSELYAEEGVISITSQSNGDDYSSLSLYANGYPSWTIYKNLTQSDITVHDEGIKIRQQLYNATHDPTQTKTSSFIFPHHALAGDGEIIHYLPVSVTVNGGTKQFADSEGNIPITVASTGGGGGDMLLANYVVRETPSGALNGSNAVFTLANTPVAGKEMIFLNGVLQEPTTNYSISGTTITFTEAPDNTDGTPSIKVTYYKQ